jgi:hypothetical protein
MQNHLLFHLLVVAGVIDLTRAWTAPRQLLGKTSLVSCQKNTFSHAAASTESSNDIPPGALVDRRALLFGLGAAVFMSTPLLLLPANAVDATVTNDPMAQLDDIAAQIGDGGGAHRSSNYPFSISPLPTLKQSAQELAWDEADKAKKLLEEQEQLQQRQTQGSDFEQALKESKRRKQVNPLTH